jgi:hypothetical protein
LTLRWVRSSHYCMINHPYLKSKYVQKEIIKAKSDGEKEIRSVKRWYVTYRPSIHPYIGHYDAEKYKEALEKYKSGRHKSRPNGRQWHKVRYNRVDVQAQSDLDKLMAEYNFTLRDLKNKIDEKKEDIRLRDGIF